jgi:hypothetical protein
MYRALLVDLTVWCSIVTQPFEHIAKCTVLQAACVTSVKKWRGKFSITLSTREGDNMRWEGTTEVEGMEGFRSIL